MHICECQRSALGGSIDHSPPYSLRKGLSLILELTDLVKEAGKEALGILLSPSPRVRIRSVAIYLDAEDPNQGPHACLVSTLLTDHLSNQEYIDKIFNSTSTNLLIMKPY